MRSVVPEAGIKSKDKLLHPAISVDCNYFSMPFVSASGTTLQIYRIKSSKVFNLLCLNIQEYTHRQTNVSDICIPVSSRDTFLHHTYFFLFISDQCQQTQRVYNSNASSCIFLLSTNIFTPMQRPITRMTHRG